MKNYKFRPILIEVQKSGVSHMKCSLGLIAAMFLLNGCAVRHTPQGFRAIVKPSCLTAPVVMKGCDFSIDPPRCQHVEIKYRPGCAEVQVKKPEPSAAK